MASIVKHRGKWMVRWRELSVTLDGNGVEQRRWKSRRKMCPTQRAAKTLAREIETAHALGKNWSDQRTIITAAIRDVVLAYVRAAVDANAPLATQRFRSAMLGGFLDFLDARNEDGTGVHRTMKELSLTLLETYANSLPGDGRKGTTRYRKVMEVERMWRWASERPERFPDVPPPKRYTGGSADADRLSPPPPVYAIAAPTWLDVDRMISQLKIEWHRRCATLMRFTGLRASQACGLCWTDVDLERGILFVRARVRGAKRSRSRVMPLNESLVEEMRGWGVREGLLFPRRYKGRDGEQRLDPHRGDALVAPFRRAWRLADVPADRWDAVKGVTGGRAKGSPTHAIRRCIRTELIRAGVEEAIVLYLVGQTQGVTASAYVPETSPEQSPYWPRLLDAVAGIPPVVTNVFHMERAVR
jgi:integrase